MNDSDSIDLTVPRMTDKGEIQLAQFKAVARDPRKHGLTPLGWFSEGWDAAEKQRVQSGSWVFDRVGPEATEGMLVRFVPADGDDKRVQWGANKNPVELLDPQQTYTVERAEVHKWHTKLWLADAGGPFNSAHFQAVTEVGPVDPDFPILEAEYGPDVVIPADIDPDREAFLADRP